MVTDAELTGLMCVNLWVERPTNPHPHPRADRAPCTGRLPATPGPCTRNAIHLDLAETGHPATQQPGVSASGGLDGPQDTQLIERI